MVKTGKLFGGDTLIALFLIIVVSIGGLFWAHKDTGFNYWEDDFNMLRYFKTGDDGCSTFPRPFAPYGEVSRKVLLQPPADYLKQFNTSVRSIPWWLLYTTFRVFGSENVPGQNAALPQFILNFLLYAVDIVLFYLFAALLFGKRIGWFAALFFSVNPVNAGFLGWPVQASDPVGFLFAMVCLISHLLIAKYDRPASRWRLVSLGAFLLLTLTKESFLSLWAVIAAIHVYQDWLGGKSLALGDAIPRYARLLLPYWIVILLFFALHRLYFGAPPQIHAQFDFSPKALLCKLVLYPYFGATFWSLNVKGFLFSQGRAMLVDTLTLLFWSGGLLFTVILIRAKRIPWHAALFCWVLFHAGSLHLILMHHIDVEHQRWLLYGSPGTLLLMALAADALFSASKHRALSAVWIGLVFIAFYLGFLNNLGPWAREGYLESVRIPKAVRQKYPVFPDRYHAVYFAKDAREYIGATRSQKNRTIGPSGYYGHLALQYWYGKERSFCLVSNPVDEWGVPENGALYMVYDYGKDAMLFYEGGASGTLLSAGAVAMASVH